jgi:DNA topoisomerase-1
MNKTLVIVESPGKIKKIQSYLGNNYIVKASVGHIMDLDPTKMSIDIILQDNGKYIFVPNYITMKDKTQVVTNLKTNIKNTSDVILAADEDREGEFIAFSLEKQLKLKNPKRIVFNAITKEAITSAIANPKTIDMNMVHAQQSRRLLDRLVGYMISPLLGSGLSAGRVQSVVVKLIIEKENEIKKDLEEMKSNFIVNGNFGKLEAKLYPNYQTIDTEIIKKELINMIEINPYFVSNVEIKETERSPPSPFITSSLQQEASNKLKFNPATTMQIAQKLYEKGYITYMRTDSCSIDKNSSALISKYIKKEYGEDYYKYRTFKNKENSQEAHECIRPTYINNPVIDEENTDNEKKLYELIWKRTIASQMANAIYENQIITIENKDTSFKGKYFKTTNKKLIFDGFLKVYNDSNSTQEEFIDIKKDEKISLNSAVAKEEFNYNNSRYSEASLIKRLEDLLIGRPSTYVSILGVIQKRDYVKITNVEGISKDVSEISVDSKKKIKEKVKKITIGGDKKRFIPTETGIQVNNYLEENFSNIFNYQFTAELENKLDIIAQGKGIDQQEILNEIYTLIKPKVDSLTKARVIIYKSENRFIGEDVLGTKYTILKCKNNYAIKKDFPNIRESLFFGIDEDKKDSLTLEEAVEMTKDLRLLGVFRNKPVFLTKGAYGPYIKYGTKNISLKGHNENISFDIAKKLL